MALAGSLGLSQCRACVLWNMPRSGVGFERKKAVSGGVLGTVKKRALALLYPWYGYRRVQIFMACEGFLTVAPRAKRLWNFPPPRVPRKRHRRRVEVRQSRLFASRSAN